jgi:hypothetical protein
MHLITLVSVALAVSASALPRIVSERDLAHSSKRAVRRQDNNMNGGNDSDPQTSLSKFNESLHVFITLTLSF